MNTYTLARRRYYGIKKQLWTVLITFAIVLVGFSAGGSLLKAHQVQASNAYKEVVYYKSIEVNTGDTLWEIADEYMGDEFSDRESYIKEVKRINHLTDDTIQSGAYLMIPYTETVTDIK